jgi:hypothetical protein
VAWQQKHLRRDAPPLALAVDAELGQVMVQPACGKRSSLMSCPSTIAKPAKEAGVALTAVRVLYGVMGEIEARLMVRSGAPR